MKEALGELNGTIIVVIAVGLLMAFFFTVLWPNIKGDLQNNAKCSDAICDVGINKNAMTDCYSPGTEKSKTFECPYRG